MTTSQETMRVARVALFVLAYFKQQGKVELSPEVVATSMCLGVEAVRLACALLCEAGALSFSTANLRYSTTPEGLALLQRIDSLETDDVQLLAFHLAMGLLLPSTPLPAGVPASKFFPVEVNRVRLNWARETDSLIHAVFTLGERVPR